MAKRELWISLKAKNHNLHSIYQSSLPPLLPAQTQRIISPKRLATSLSPRVNILISLIAWLISIIKLNSQWLLLTCLYLEEASSMSDLGIDLCAGKPVWPLPDVSVSLLKDGSSSYWPCSRMLGCFCRPCAINKCMSLRNSLIVKWSERQCMKIGVWLHLARINSIRWSTIDAN